MGSSSAISAAPKSEAMGRFGPEAAVDFAAAPVTAAWRRQHLLIAAKVALTGPLIDLTDVPTRQEIEQRHLKLLVAHGLEHLDLHEITTKRRDVTQTIAADLYDRGAAAVWFPSCLDGLGCVALFEGRGGIHAASDPVALNDPAPLPLAAVTAAWGLELEPSPLRDRPHSPVKLGVRFANIAAIPSVRSFDGRNAEFHAAT